MILQRFTENIIGIILTNQLESFRQSNWNGRVRFDNPTKTEPILNEGIRLWRVDNEAAIGNLQPLQIPNLLK